MKILVDGYGGVGKTTLLKRLEYGIFDPDTRLTIGVDFFCKKYPNLFGHDVTTQFWDVVGASRFDFLRPICYKGSNCVILVVDVTRPITLERIDYFLDVAQNCNINPDQIILVGAKTDLFYERTVDTTYLTSFLEKYGLAEIVETSARNNHNLEALFELATVIAMYHKELISKQDFILFNENIKKRIQEPVPEPYEKLIRKCYKCGRTLLFHEFYDSNNKNFSEDRLFKLWESPYLQFYCCTCYKDLSYNQNRN